MYAAGSDVRHGVRIVATFEVPSAAGDAELGHGNRYPVLHNADAPGKRRTVPNRQVIVFYTIPPDMFHNISRAGIDANVQLGGDRGEVSSEWAAWRADMSYHEIDIYSDPYTQAEVYPVEMLGQRVTEGNGLVEIGLDSGPDRGIWAFSVEGWARAWALDTGVPMPHTDTFRWTAVFGSWMLTAMWSWSTSPAPVKVFLSMRSCPLMEAGVLSRLIESLPTDTELFQEQTEWSAQSVWTW